MLDPDLFAKNPHSARRGAVGGPSGMTSEHLRPLLDMTRFWRFTQDLAKAAVPDDIVELVRFARWLRCRNPMWRRPGHRGWRHHPSFGCTNGPSGLHTTAREFQTCIGGSRSFKHHQNSTRRQKERKWERRGKKSAKFWPATLRGPIFSGFGLHPLGHHHDTHQIQKWIGPNWIGQNWFWPKIGRAKTKMAKSGVAKIGQMRMAKKGIGQSRSLPIARRGTRGGICNHLQSAVVGCVGGGNVQVADVLVDCNATRELQRTPKRNLGDPTLPRWRTLRGGGQKSRADGHTRKCAW